MITTCDVCQTPQPTARPCGPCKANICDNCRGDVPARAKAAAKARPWLAVGAVLFITAIIGMGIAYAYNRLNPSDQ